MPVLNTHMKATKIYSADITYRLLFYRYLTMPLFIPVVYSFDHSLIARESKTIFILSELIICRN